MLVTCFMCLCACVYAIWCKLWGKRSIAVSFYIWSWRAESQRTGRAQRFKPSEFCCHFEVIFVVSIEPTKDYFITNKNKNPFQYRSLAVLFYWQFSFWRFLVVHFAFKVVFWSVDEQELCEKWKLISNWGMSVSIVYLKYIMESSQK